MRAANSSMCAAAALSILLCVTPTLATTPVLEELYETAQGYGFSVRQLITHENIIIAHGVMMAFAFAFMFPFGGAMIRIWHPGTIIWLHAWWQVTAYLIAGAGFGMGVWLAKTQSQLLHPSGHPILGMIVVPVLLLMPGIGWAHHLALQKTGVRNLATKLHIWIARPMIVAGGINGGLGIYMNALQATVWLPSYIAVSGFFYLLWFVSAIQWQIRYSRKIKRQNGSDVEKNSKRDSLSSLGMAASEHESVAGVGKVYYSS